MQVLSSLVLFGWDERGRVLWGAGYDGRYRISLMDFALFAHVSLILDPFLPGAGRGDFGAAQGDFQARSLISLMLVL